MTEISALLDELKIIHEGEPWHGPALHELLHGVNVGQAVARPHADVHNIWEIVSHISGWEAVSTSRLKGHSAESPEAGDFPSVADPSEQAWQDALLNLDGTHQELLATVAELDDSSLPAIVAGRSYTVRFLLGEIVRHHVYHAGQIALLKKIVTR